MVTTTNLVGYWKCDEASGNLIDAHNSNDLTASGIVYGQTGVINDAIGCSATDTQVATGVSMTSDDYSIQMWMKPTTNTGTHILFDDYNSGVGRFYIWGTHTGLSSSTMIGYYDGTTARNWGVAMTAGAYHHYLFVF